MNAATNTSDEDAEEAAGPALALPPIYVLRSTVRCPECGQALHVYTLGCAGYRDPGESQPTEVFHFLRLVESLPESVLRLLAARCPGYGLDQEPGDTRRYLMNHCRCGAGLDDDYLHGDVGTAFWPDTPEGYATIRPFLLPIGEAIPIVSSYSVGGDEYFGLEDSEPW